MPGCNGLIVNGKRRCVRVRKNSDIADKQMALDYEKRILQLEIEVELLRDFLSEEERRLIKKQYTGSYTNAGTSIRL